MLQFRFCLSPSVRIEETWRLWQKFLDDFARFEEWLATSEKTAALPNSSGVLYTVAKEELKKFEVLQKNYANYLNDYHQRGQILTFGDNVHCLSVFVGIPETSP